MMKIQLNVYANQNFYILKIFTNNYVLKYN